MRNTGRRRHHCEPGIPPERHSLDTASQQLRVRRLGFESCSAKTPWQLTEPCRASTAFLGEQGYGQMLWKILKGCATGYAGCVRVS